MRQAVLRDGDTETEPETQIIGDTDGRKESETQRGRDVDREREKLGKTQSQRKAQGLTQVRSTEGSGLGSTKQMGAEYSGHRGGEAKERRTQTPQERPTAPDL